jgi:hypothetical protein
MVVTSVALVVLGLLFVDPRAVFADRSMRPPEDACPRLELGPRQCAAVVARALEAAELDATEIAAVTMGRPDGPRRGQIAVVDMTTHAGTRHVEEIWCGGVGSRVRAWCSEDPPLQLWMGANHDTPACADGGEPCVTPIALDPAAVAAARPLSIASIDLPLSVGAHDIELGRALIANGYLAEARFSLADPAPDGVVIPKGVRLEVEPADPSRPPMGNAYERGTIPGVEEVVVRLRFVVEAAPPDAVLQVRDVLIR